MYNKRLINDSLLSEISNRPFKVEFVILKKSDDLEKEKIKLETKLNNPRTKSKIMTAKELFSDFGETSHNIWITDTSFNQEIQFATYTDNGTKVLVAYKNLGFNWYGEQTGINDKMSIYIIGTILTFAGINLYNIFEIDDVRHIAVYKSQSTNVVIGVEYFCRSKEIYNLYFCYRIKSGSDEEKDATKLINKRNEIVANFFDQNFYYGFNYGKIIQIMHLCDISFIRSMEGSPIAVDPIIFFDDSIPPGYIRTKVIDDKLLNYIKLKVKK